MSVYVCVRAHVRDTSRGYEGDDGQVKACVNYKPDEEII